MFHMLMFSCWFTMSLELKTAQTVSWVKFRGSRARHRDLSAYESLMEWPSENTLENKKETRKSDRDARQAFVIPRGRLWSSAVQ